MPASPGKPLALAMVAPIRGGGPRKVEDWLANIAQLNRAIEGLVWNAATQANINLASPGAVIDGVTMAANDRVLVRAQTASAENGLYLWTGATTPMTRASDAGTFDEFENTVTKLAGWAARFRKASATIGDGVATLFTVTHNFGTRAVNVQVWETSGLYRQVLVEVRAVSVNAVAVLFDAAPAVGAYLIVIEA